MVRTWAIVLTGILMGISFHSLGDEKLSTRLDHRAKRSEAKTTPKARKIMLESLQALKAKKIEQKAPKVGETLPEFELKDATGKTFQLKQMLTKGPVLVVFYRGSWCPYCNLQLRAYQQYLSRFREAGGQMVAITPEMPDASLPYVKEHGFDFPVLTDTNNLYARRLKIAFKVDSALRALYETFGVDLNKTQGNENWELPVPATYVVDQKGIVTFAYVNVNHKQRAEPEDILKAFKKMK